MAACFRYIVNDVNASIEFYTERLGFKLEMHPAPSFAEISRGDTHIYLTEPLRVGGGAPGLGLSPVLRHPQPRPAAGNAR